MQLFRVEHLGEHLSCLLVMNGPTVYAYKEVNTRSETKKLVCDRAYSLLPLRIGIPSSRTASIGSRPPPLSGPRSSPPHSSLACPASWRWCGKTTRSSLVHPNPTQSPLVHPQPARSPLVHPKRDRSAQPSSSLAARRSLRPASLFRAHFPLTRAVVEIIYRIFYIILSI